MNDKIVNYIYAVLIILLVGNLFTNITTSLILSFLLIISQFMCLRRSDVAIVFILSGAYIGSFYANEGIRFIGSILIWSSAIILLKDLFTYKLKWISNFSPLIFFLFVVLISILTTSGGSYSSEKYFSMLQNVVLYTIAFSHIVLFREKHSFESIGFMMLLYTLFILGYMNELMGVKISFNGLFHSFAGFRNDINDYLSGDKDVFHVSYQAIGIDACIALVFSLFSTKQMTTWYKIIIFILSTLVIWYSAARQSIFLYVVIWLLYLIHYKGFRIKNIIILLFSIIGGYIVLSSLDTNSLEFLFGSTEGKDSARYDIIQSAMSQFNSSPLVGVGFGRFFHKGEYGCNEHNLFVELLTEMGIIGFLLFIVIIVHALCSSYNFIKQNFRLVYPLILFLIVYFLRAMVSSDLRETIVILIIVLCIKMSYKIKSY